MRGHSFVLFSSQPTTHTRLRLLQRPLVGFCPQSSVTGALVLALLRRALGLFFLLSLSLVGQADDISAGSPAEVQSRIDRKNAESEAPATAVYEKNSTQGSRQRPSRVFEIDSKQTQPSSNEASEQEIDQNLRERLRKKYQSVASLTSQVSQVKSSRFLSVPLRSTARLEWSSGRVLWKTLKPVPSEVLIADGTIRVTDAGGTVTDLLQMKAGVPQASVQPVLAAVLSFLQRLFAFDFAELERDFSFVESGNMLKASVRPGSPLHFFRSFTLAFDEKLTLEKLELEEATGTTEMVFTDVQIGTKAY